MAKAIFSPFAGFILYDAVYSGTAPSSTYALSTFAENRPDRRVKWGATTVTITATLAGGSRKADLFALPISNIDAGATKLSLTNGAGLNVPITVPAVPTGPYGRLPLTTVTDLRGLASAGTRTSNVWNVIITANSVNLTMGAAIWLGTCVDFTANFRPGLVQGSRFFNGGDTNFFGTTNRVRSRARQRFAEFSIPTLNAQRDAVMDWVDSGEGSGLPSILWTDPSVNDALYGSFADEVSNALVVPNYSPIDGLRFTEWSKGIPLL